MNISIPIQPAAHKHTRPDGIYAFDARAIAKRFRHAAISGAPPGYVGYEEGGYLTEAVRRKPYSVILLDEVRSEERRVGKECRSRWSPYH